MLRTVAPSVGLVPLSHGDVAHLGALPYLRKELGLVAPVFSTDPVKRLGQIAMLDAFGSSIKAQREQEDWPFDVADINGAFSQMTMCKFLSRSEITKGSTHITIVPVNAGHTVGGAVWSITVNDTDTIVYAVDYNHEDENHLNGFNFLSITRPTLLITGAYNCEMVGAAQDGRHQPRLLREQELLHRMMLSFRSNGSVLIPCDGVLRVLEMLMILERQWEANRLSASYQIYWVNPTADRTRRLAGPSY